jgi:DNA repair exonuclease SbcCD ATPase subunit
VTLAKAALNQHQITKEADSSKAAADALHAALLLHPLLSGVQPGGSVPQYLDTTLSTLEARMTELDSERRSFADIADLDQAATNAAKARRVADSKLAETKEELLKTRAEIARLESALETFEPRASLTGLTPRTR